MQELRCSPFSRPASFLTLNDENPKLIIVTGRRGSGKSTLCAALIDQARAKGLTVTGLLSPAIFESGFKIGIDLIYIGTSARHRLAIRRSEMISQQRSSHLSADWQFDEVVLDWGNNMLQRLQASDLLILDELGPLELLQNQGFVAGLQLIDERKYRLNCIVVRPILLAAALERWPWGSVLYLPESTLS